MFLSQKEYEANNWIVLKKSLIPCSLNFKNVFIKHEILSTLQRFRFRIKKIKRSFRKILFKLKFTLKEKISKKKNYIMHIRII